MHRVAAAMLSGAGLMVLLPAVERDSVVTVIRRLALGELDVVNAALIAAVVVAISLPFLALWLVLADLASFYFHANHISIGGREMFTQRFTLTGLRLPDGELSPPVQRALAARRSSPEAVEVLIADNVAARDRIDRQISAYRIDAEVPISGDDERVSMLFALAASRPRPLLDEVAKVEHGLTRHVLRTQVIVLRYLKALIALLATALAVFVMAAVATSSPTLTAGSDIGLALVVMWWAPLVVTTVTAPARWLENQLRADAASHTAIHADSELTQMERTTVRIAGTAFLLAGLSITVSIADSTAPDATKVVGAVGALFALGGLSAAVLRWGHGHPLRRLAGA